MVPRSAIRMRLIFGSTELLARDNPHCFKCIFFVLAFSYSMSILLSPSVSVCISSSSFKLGVYFCLSALMFYLLAREWQSQHGVSSYIVGRQNIDGARMNLVRKSCLFVVWVLS